MHFLACFAAANTSSACSCACSAELRAPFATPLRGGPLYGDRRAEPPSRRTCADPSGGALHCICFLPDCVALEVAERSHFDPAHQARRGPELVEPTDRAAAAGAAPSPRVSKARCMHSLDYQSDSHPTPYVFLAPIPPTTSQHPYQSPIRSVSSLSRRRGVGWLLLSLPAGPALTGLGPHLPLACLLLPRYESVRSMYYFDTRTLLIRKFARAG